MSDKYGYDRGISADRVLVDRYVAQHAADIRGNVLEVMEAVYTTRHGGLVTRRDVVDVDATNRRATIVVDLSAPGALPRGRFDCFVMTQTLYLLSDPLTALRTAFDSLTPGGVLLLTTPVVARMDPVAGPTRDYWRLPPAGLHQLLRWALPDEADVEVTGHGNLLVSVAALLGVAAEELSNSELEVEDERFPVLSAARVVRTS